MRTHAVIRQEEDILIVRTPSATLKILLPKIEGAHGIIQTAQVYEECYEKQVDLVAQGGFFQVLDIDHQVLFEYQETGHKTTQVLQPVAEIQEGNKNISTADESSEDSSGNGRGARQPRDRPPEPIGCRNKGDIVEQEAATPPLGSHESIFLSESPQSGVNKRKVDSEIAPDDYDFLTPERKKRISIVPLANVDQKAMLASERLSDHPASQNVTPRPSKADAVKGTPQRRRSSAPTAHRILPQAIITPPNKKTKTRGIDSSLSRQAQRGHASASVTPYGASPPTANAGTLGPALNKRTPTPSRSASTKTQKLNNQKRVKGTQAVVTKWKGMAGYNPNAQNRRSGEQTSSGSAEFEDDILFVPPRDEPSPTAIRGMNRKDAKKPEKAHPPVGKATVPKPKDISAGKGNTLPSNPNRQNKRKIPVWASSNQAQYSESAEICTGESQSYHKEENGGADYCYGETSLGNGPGLESNSNVPRSSPMKGKKYRTQHDVETGTRRMMPVSQDVVRIQDVIWINADSDDETFEPPTTAGFSTRVSDASTSCSNPYAPKTEEARRSAAPLLTGGHQRASNMTKSHIPTHEDSKDASAFKPDATLNASHKVSKNTSFNSKRGRL